MGVDLHLITLTEIFIELSNDPKSEVKTINTGVYEPSKHSRTKSVDGHYWDSTGKVLYLFQMTLSLKHDVKAEGLIDQIKSMQNKLKKKGVSFKPAKTSIKLVFVVPKSLGKYKQQNITIKVGNKINEKSENNLNSKSTNKNDNISIENLYSKSTNKNDNNSIENSNDKANNIKQFDFDTIKDKELKAWYVLIKDIPQYVNFQVWPFETAYELWKAKQKF